MTVQAADQSMAGMLNVRDVARTGHFYTELGTLAKFAILGVYSGL